MALLFLIGRRISGPRPGRGARVPVGDLPVHPVRDEFGCERLACRGLRPRRDRGLERARRAARWRPSAALTKFGSLALAPAAVAARSPADASCSRSRSRSLGDGAARDAPDRRPGTSRCEPSTTERSSYQAERESPFSIWGALRPRPRCRPSGRSPSIALALAVALVPRRRDLVGLAALCAAILIALQIGVSHWFYLYIVWFFPLLADRVGGRPSDRRDR